MRRVGESLRAAKVAAIYLAHGTFAGADPLGLLAWLARWSPARGESAQRFVKSMVDAVMSDVGNWSPDYAELLQEALNGGGHPRIAVRRFVWSSENHHLGRADGAIRLLHELLQASLEPGQRVVLWGHSHAGNLFALLSNLLGTPRDDLERFFAACSVYYDKPLFGRVGLKLWSDMRDRLLADERPLRDTPLDIVTFGAPIRYGWETLGHARLLHFVNHRPCDGRPEYRALFPVAPERIEAAADGDFIHQLGVAGSDFPPNPFSWRSMLANHRLHRLLQPGVRRRDLLERLRLGMRVAEEGQTLLVAYDRPQGDVFSHLAGHGVYTQTKWMLFHAEEMSRRFYAGETCD